MGGFNTPLTSAGIPYQTVMNIPADSNFYFKGFTMTAADQAWTILDMGVRNDLVGPLGLCYFAGGVFKCRGTWAEDSELSVQFVDRDDVYGAFAAYGLNRAKLDNLTSISGTFQTGELVEGGTSGCRAVVLAVGADYLEVSHHRWDKDDDKLSNFTDAEQVTGIDSSATATLDTPAFTEGDALFLRHVGKHESIEGDDIGVFAPGGSEPLIEGVYIRLKLWNPDTSAHRISFRFDTGLK